MKEITRKKNGYKVKKNKSFGEIISYMKVHTYVRGRSTDNKKKSLF